MSKQPNVNLAQRLTFHRCRFLALLVLSCACLHAHAQTMKSVSLQNLPLEPGERIVGFHIEVKAGAFDSIGPLPVGWSLDIDNDASWMTTAEGSITVGAAAYDKQQFERLHFRIKKNEFGDLKFSVNGTVTVTKDFEHDRQIILSSKNIQVQQLSPSRKRHSNVQ